MKKREGSHLINIQGDRPPNQAWGTCLQEHFQPSVTRPLRFRGVGGREVAWQAFHAHVTRRLGVRLGSDEGYEFSVNGRRLVAFVTNTEIRVEIAPQDQDVAHAL